MYTCRTWDTPYPYTICDLVAPRSSTRTTSWSTPFPRAFPRPRFPRQTPQRRTVPWSNEEEVKMGLDGCGIGHGSAAPVD